MSGGRALSGSEADAALWVEHQRHRLRHGQEARVLKELASLKPVAKTDKCQASHVGYAVQGRITVRLADGTEKTISAGDSYTIPPGHDAWVVGNEPAVVVEFQGMIDYAKST